MRSLLRSLGVVSFVMACVVTLGWAAPLTVLVQLAGTTALIMGGTQHPLINPSNRLADVDGRASYGFSESGLADAAGLPAGYVGDVMNTYIRPNGPADENYDVQAIWTPEAFWPTFGNQTFNASVKTGLGSLDGCLRTVVCTAHVYPNADQGDETDGYSVFAYSQSARIASLEKSALINAYQPDDPTTAQHVTFVMIGNPNRPNGGILQRFKGLYIPILDVSFDGATRTDSPVVDGQYLYPTADIARQYDGWADFPTYPLNLLADLNALAGIMFLHGDYFVGNKTNPVAGQQYLYQGQTGDTNYYMIPTRRMPLLVPLAMIGVPDFLLAALDAPLRVLTEWGYNRTTSPGDPNHAHLIGWPWHPIRDVLHLVYSVFTGLDDSVSELFGNPEFRPFHTTPVTSTFGVGGAVLPTADAAVAPSGPATAENTLRTSVAESVREVGPATVAADAPAEKQVQQELSESPSPESAKMTETVASEAETVPTTPEAAPVEPQAAPTTPETVPVEPTTELPTPPAQALDESEANEEPEGAPGKKPAEISENSGANTGAAADKQISKQEPCGTTDDQKPANQGPTESEHGDGTQQRDSISAKPKPKPTADTGAAQ